MTRKEIKEMKKRWREALVTPTKPLYDPVPFGEVMDKYFEGKELCEDCSRSEDCISRQQAIDKMQELEDEDIEAYGCAIPEGFDGKRAIEALNTLSSILQKTETGVEIIKTEETEESGIKYLNINVSNSEVERNPDIVRLCSDAGILEYAKPKTDVLDKIRAEIELIPTIEWKDDGTTYILASYFKKQVLEIIDKYKADSEVG